MVTASLVGSLVRRWRESFDERLRRLRAIQAAMQTAGSYPEWLELAQQLDAMGHARGGEQAGRMRESLYDRLLLQQKAAHLQAVRQAGSPREMMFALRADLIRNIANIAKRCGRPQRRRRRRPAADAAASSSGGRSVCRGAARELATATAGGAGAQLLALPQPPAADASGSSGGSSRKSAAAVCLLDPAAACCRTAPLSKRLPHGACRDAPTMTQSQPAARALLRGAGAHPGVHSGAAQPSLERTSAGVVIAVQQHCGAADGLRVLGVLCIACSGCGKQQPNSSAAVDAGSRSRSPAAS